MPVLRRGARELCVSPALQLLGALGVAMSQGNSLVLGSLHPIPSLPALGAPSFGVQERELSRTQSITRSRAGALQKQRPW